MMLWNYDAFVLDLDGTLIDSGKYHAQAFYDAVLEQSGYALTQSERHEFFASHSSRFALVLNERHGLSLDSEQVLAYKRMRVRDIFKAELFAGARNFLELWHGKIPMALATNSPRSFVQPALEAVGLVEYFEHIITADDVAHRKPHPDIVEICIKKLAVTPAKTLVFEDQLIGIEAALSAGAHVVAVDNGQPVIYPLDIAVYGWDELLKLSEMT